MSSTKNFANLSICFSTMPDHLANTHEPSVWVGCVDCYTNGVLNGKWLYARHARSGGSPVALHGEDENFTDYDFSQGRHDKALCYISTQLPLTDSLLTPAQAEMWGLAVYEVAEGIDPDKKKSEVGAFITWTQQLGLTRDIDEALRTYSEHRNDFVENYAENLENFHAYTTDTREYVSVRE